VEPLAERVGVAVERSTLLAEGAEWVSAYRLLVHLDEHHGVACAHGDLIPHLLRHLRDQGMHVDGAMHDHKGSVWVLETDGGHVVRGTYRRPEVGAGVVDDDAELESA
jgi:8-oxo-dGTP diphosphatase